MDKKTLSLLSLLIIPGILLMPICNDHLKLIPIMMCAIGGYCFGKLIANSL